MENLQAQEWQILLVDDDEDDYLITRSMLSQARGRKITLHRASTYLEGMHAILADVYDAVLVDFDLGPRTGLELIREVVSEDYPAPLILYTGRGSYEVDVEAMQAGATSYLTKSEATPLLLERSIRYAIERKQIEEESHRANAALRKERAQLEAILNQMPAGVVISDARTGELILSNEQVANIWGRSYTALEDDSAAQETRGIHADGQPYRPEEWPLARAVTSGEVVTDEEIRFRRGDGTTGVMNASASPIYDEDGEITAGVLVFADITERKWIEEALLESQQRLLTIAESMPLPLVYIDREERFLFVNDAYADFHGLSRKEIIGRTVEEIVGDMGYQQLASYLKQGLSGQALAFETEVTYPKLGLRYIRFTFAPQRDDSRGTTALLAVLEDLTEEKQAKQTLRQSEERLSLALKAAKMVAWEWNPVEDRVVTTDNFEEVFGLPSLRTVRDVYKYVHPGDLPGYQKNLETVVQHGGQYHIEYRVLRPEGGDQLWVEGWGFAVAEHDGRVQKLIGVAWNITERKKAEEALRESAAMFERSNRELEQFAFVASHDLQEPLRKIEAFSSLLKKRIGDQLGEEEYGYLERMREAAQRMQKMVDDLLTLSRVTTKGKPHTKVNLSEVARTVVDNLEVRIRQTGGRVHIANLPVIEADPLQMHQLLQNLIGNALKFHREGVPPVIHVRSKTRQANCVEIAVADNGIGFDMANLERIFGPFQRLHGRSEFEGTGIGLAICRKIVERHGGSITAKSTPGMGSTFILMLPIQQSRE